MSEQENLQEIPTLEIKTEENFNKVLEAISGMREEFIQRFDKLENRVGRIEAEQVEIKKKVEKIETEQILIRKKVEKIETELDVLSNFVDMQFEAVRLGLEKNYNQFDRIDAQISENRAAIFTTKALVGELKERVYLLSRDTKQSF